MSLNSFTFLIIIRKETQNFGTTLYYGDQLRMAHLLERCFELIAMFNQHAFVIQNQYS